MEMNASRFLRVSLVLSIGFLLPGAPLFEAAAQTVPVAINPGGGLGASSAGISLRVQGALAQFQIPSLSLGLSLPSSKPIPSFSVQGSVPTPSPVRGPAAATTVVEAAVPGAVVGVEAAAKEPPSLERGRSPLARGAAAARAADVSFAARPLLSGEAETASVSGEEAGPAQEPGRGALSVLGSVARPDVPMKNDLTGASLRFGRLYDGGAKFRAEAAVHAESMPATKSAGGLARAVAEGPVPVDGSQVPSPSQILSPRSSNRVWTRVAAGAVLALLLLVPGVALAAGVPAAAGASAALLTTVHPAATAFAAAAGALYGVVSALRREGPPPSAGELMAAALRMGIASGAGVFVLLDLAQALFLGVAVSALTPLSSALATAALGQGAFQGKFTDPAASSADRILGAFPAVAAALGLSVGVLMTAQSLLLSLLLGAMSLTGVAAAVYSALYRPGSSPAEGPASMARGYVLQSLMTGLALAVTGPYLAFPFMALAAWGLWDVLNTLAREVLTRFRDRP